VEAEGEQHRQLEQQVPVAEPVPSPEPPLEVAQESPLEVAQESSP
jgi:hypothetical protein